MLVFRNLVSVFPTVLAPLFCKFVLNSSDKPLGQLVPGGSGGEPVDFSEVDGSTLFLPC